MQFTQYRRDVVTSTGPSDQTCGGVLDRLYLPKKGVTVVETAASERLDRCSDGGGGHWT